jgi:hypothetical protein
VLFKFPCLAGAKEKQLSREICEIARGKFAMLAQQSCQPAHMKVQQGEISRISRTVRHDGLMSD